MPSDLKTAKETEEWHQKNDQWFETVPPNDNGYSEKWFLRAQDLVDKYHPDLLYLDDNELPLGQYGLDIAAHYYNANRAFHGGRLEAVLDAKYMKPEHRAAVVQDIERGVAEGISAAPWQTDTCIGSWHYERRLFDEHKYKTVAQVVHLLVDVVSKNGNLLLSVPLRGDGTIDDDELAFLGGHGEMDGRQRRGDLRKPPLGRLRRGPVRPPRRPRRASSAGRGMFAPSPTPPRTFASPPRAMRSTPSCSTGRRTTASSSSSFRGRLRRNPGAARAGGRVRFPAWLGRETPVAARRGGSARGASGGKARKRRVLRSKSPSSSPRPRRHPAVLRQPRRRLQSLNAW